MISGVLIKYDGFKFPYLVWFLVQASQIAYTSETDICSYSHYAFTI